MAYPFISFHAFFTDKRLTLDHKILIMQLLSRVMGSHKLCVLGFYTYVVKYLTYHQLRVTSILVSLAQSVHDLTPPDVLTPVIQKLAHEFVHPGVGSEVIAAGINSIREVCRRQPWCMEADLLGDLIEYRKSRDKGVITASRGLLHLYREVNPGLLKKRERVRDYVPTPSINMFSNSPFCLRVKLRAWACPAERSHCRSAMVRQRLQGSRGSRFAFSLNLIGRSGYSLAPDAKLLEDELERLRAEDGIEPTGEDEDDDAGWEGWDAESDSSEDSEASDWIDVDHSDDEMEIQVSDSEDEKPKNRNKDEAEEKKESDVNTPVDDPLGPAPSRISTLATTKVRKSFFFVLNPCSSSVIDAVSVSDPNSGGFCTFERLADQSCRQRG